MSKAYSRTAGGTVVAVLSVSAADAQPPAGPNERAEEVFVTGSRISRDGFDTPTPVTAIDADYIEGLGLVNVGEAVQQLPITRAQFTPLTNGWGGFKVAA